MINYFKKKWDKKNKDNFSDFEIEIIKNKKWYYHNLPYNFCPVSYSIGIIFNEYCCEYSLIDEYFKFYDEYKFVLSFKIV